MFKTAGVRFVRSVFYSISTASLAGLLGACTHSSPPDPGGPKSWVVENVASKTTEELYRDLIKPGVFERSSSKVIDGYTVESGKLRMPDKSEGALVTVRSPNGSLLAFINKLGTNGSLHVDSKGVSRFAPEPVAEGDVDDAIPNAIEKFVISPAPTSEGPYIIDLLMGYSKAGVDRAGGDAMADALAKVELVNLALHNSLVKNVSFKLVGVQVVEQEYLVNLDTLRKIPVIFSEGIEKFNPDVIYGNFATFAPGGPVGQAYMPGRTGILISNASMTFAHELGHNANSHHCNTNGAANYRFGFNNGNSGSLLCYSGSNRKLYYSTPSLKDEQGLPRGNAVTADTARVWRENAARLSSYAVSIPQNFRKTGSTITTVTFSWDPSSDAARYDVYRNVLNGSEIVKVGEVTGLTYVASTTSNRTIYYVKAVGAQGTESKLSNGASR